MLILTTVRAAGASSTATGAPTDATALSAPQVVFGDAVPACTCSSADASPDQGGSRDRVLHKVCSAQVWPE